MPPGVVIPIQTTDAGKQQIQSQLDNLGSQMSALVQSYNDLRGQVEGHMGDPAVRDQMRTLLDQRRAAIQNLQTTFMAAKHQAENQGIAVTSQIPALAGFRGLGADDLSGLQTAVGTEQSKLAALAAYYQQAQAAVAAGQPVPPVPSGLSTTSTVMGIPMMWLLIGGAVLLFMFSKK